MDYYMMIIQSLFHLKKEKILYITKLRQYKMEEVPINWSNVEGSKVNVFIDSPKMFLEVLKISIGAWTGRYKKLITSSD